MYLKRNPDTSFVAIMEGSIIGVILAGHDGRRGVIHHTSVALSKRGQGIGKRLVKAALKALEQENIYKVLMVVFSDNEIGNTFWESQGFTKREDLIYRNKALTELPAVKIGV